MIDGAVRVHDAKDVGRIRSQVIGCESECEPLPAPFNIIPLENLYTHRSGGFGRRIRTIVRDDQ